MTLQQLLVVLSVPMLICTGVAQGNSCAGNFPDVNIATFVQSAGDISGGQDTVLSYEQILLNEGSGWRKSTNTFIAPCPGLYRLFTSFEKDGYYNGGTSDDVEVYFTKNGVKTNINSAWAGYDAIRTLGATEGILRLNSSDKIQTWIHTDLNDTRNSRRLSLVIYRIGN